MVFLVHFFKCPKYTSRLPKEVNALYASEYSVQTSTCMRQDVSFVCIFYFLMGNWSVFQAPVILGALGTGTLLKVCIFLPGFAALFLWITLKVLLSSWDLAWPGNLNSHKVVVFVFPAVFEGLGFCCGWCLGLFLVVFFPSIFVFPQKNKFSVRVCVYLVQFAYCPWMGYWNTTCSTKILEIVVIISFL